MPCGTFVPSFVQTNEWTVSPEDISTTIMDSLGDIFPTLSDPFIAIGNDIEQF